LEDEKATLLIVEDDLDIADMLNAYFRIQGYEVLTVNWGEDGVRAAQTSNPDLVILDVHLPDIDGFEVARRLRATRKTKSMPIIFLTAKRERKDRLTGLELNADDYITKPFDIQELRLRVRNSLQRARRGTLTNPITGLPEGYLVDERLTACLRDSDRAMLMLCVRNLDAFRETYGFVASDDLLRAVSIMLQDTLRESGAPGDFLGHFNPAEFIILTQPSNLAALKERAHRRLDQSFDYFYRDQDRGSEAVRKQRLAVEAFELTPARMNITDLEQFKMEVERLCRPGNH
jgi:PleD family two-component response regulator